MKRLLLILLLSVSMMSWGQELTDSIRPQIMGYAMDCNFSDFAKELSGRGFTQTGKYTFEGGKFWKLQNCKMTVLGNSNGLSLVSINSDDISLLPELVQSISDKYPTAKMSVTEEPSISNAGCFKYVWIFPKELISVECVCGDWFILSYEGEGMAKNTLERLGEAKQREESDL